MQVADKLRGFLPLLTAKYQGKMLRIMLYAVILIIFFFFYTQALERKALYYPSKEIEFTPLDLGLKYEDIFLKTKDGLRIHGWFIPAAEPFATVLYLHGNAGNISQRVEIAKAFIERNLNFFIIDYRGFGKSAGSPNERGTYLDAQAAFDYLLTRKDVDKERIVIYGKSLGGAVAIDLATRKKASALISESSFASTKDMARHIYPYMPFWLFVTDKYDSCAKIDKVAMPKLIIHSHEDEIVPFSQGEKLFQKASEPKEFYVMHGGHNDAFFVHNTECMQKITDFIERHLK